MKNRNNSSAIIFLVAIWLVLLLMMGNSIYKNAIEFSGPKYKLELQELFNGSP